MPCFIPLTIANSGNTVYENMDYVVSFHPLDTKPNDYAGRARLFISDAAIGDSESLSGNPKRRSIDVKETPGEILELIHNELWADDEPPQFPLVPETPATSNSLDTNPPDILAKPPRRAKPKPTNP